MTRTIDQLLEEARKGAVPSDLAWGWDTCAQKPRVPANYA